MDECRKCNKSSPAGSRFCPFCGEKITVTGHMYQDPLINTVIANKYLIKKKLGSGAMGSIYLATHQTLEKNICLKILHKHLLLEEGHFQRFKREAKAASRLDHPNIITILDFGTTRNDITYIAMEYVGGADLASKIFKEGKHRVETAIHITKQICDALDEAHSKDVVHRDLKPENIMISKKRGDDHFVKVLDFGIAKIRDGSPGEPATFQTATGMIFGTPEYMSPEQIRGEELDGRCDLYSLGIILYEILAGQLPFPGNSILEIATKHISFPPPSIREIVPDIPEKIDKIIIRLLAKKRENRFTSASDLKKALTFVPHTEENTILMDSQSIKEISGSLSPIKEAQVSASEKITNITRDPQEKNLQEKETSKVLVLPKSPDDQESRNTDEPIDFEAILKKEKLFTSHGIYIVLIAIALGILLAIIIFLTSE